MKRLFLSEAERNPEAKTGLLFNIRRTGLFLAYLHEQFMADGCPRTAAALAYTTLLALVPLLAVVFISLSAFPAFQQLGDEIERFIFNNFVPGVDDTVRNYLEAFVQKASSLRAIGLIILIATVLALLGTIDNALNQIWRVRFKRRAVVNFLVYWAVLTLGPLLIGTGLAVSSYLISLPLVSDVETSLGLKGKLLLAMPFLTSFLAFTLIYKIVPNRDVPLSHAAIGGFVASVLFEVAKRGFGYYITNFATHEAVYGAFAVIPIFLIWVYFSWVLVLLGAQVCRCLTTFPAEARVRYGSGFDSEFLDALKIVNRLAEARVGGRSLSERRLLSLEPQLRFRRLNDILYRLARAAWVARTDSGRWVLSRDPFTETLWSLYCVVPGALPTADVGAAPTPGADADLWSRLRLRSAGIEEAMQLKLADVL